MPVVNTVFNRLLRRASDKTPACHARLPCPPARQPATEHSSLLSFTDRPLLELLHVCWLKISMTL